MEKIWNPFMEGGSCIDTNKFFIGNAVPNILTDAMILTLPAYELSRLQMKTPQKIAIGGIFMLGGLYVPIRKSSIRPDVSTTY